MFYSKLAVVYFRDDNSASKGSKRRNKMLTFWQYWLFLLSKNEVKIN